MVTRARQIDPLADGLLLRIGRRENVEQKGRRYIIEGRLRVTWIDHHRIEATCRGSDATYRLGHDSAGPYCGCPAKGRCCHLVALNLVTTRPGVCA